MVASVAGVTPRQREIAAPHPTCPASIQSGMTKRVHEKGRRAPRALGGPSSQVPHLRGRNGPQIGVQRHANECGSTEVGREQVCTQDAEGLYPKWVHEWVQGTQGRRYHPIAPGQIRNPGRRRRGFRERSQGVCTHSESKMGTYIPPLSDLVLTPLVPKVPSISTLRTCACTCAHACTHMPARFRSKWVFWVPASKTHSDLERCMYHFGARNGYRDTPRSGRESDLYPKIGYTPPTVPLPTDSS